MKRVAILIENLFDEKEFIYPYYRLQEEGFLVDIIGPKEKQQFKSKSGMSITSDLASKDAKASNYDALVIPGGFSPDYMRRTQATINFVHEMDKNKSVIGAICHGPWMMISACDLKDKKLTGFHSIQDDITNAGAIYVDKEVVVDGNLITSRTPKDLPIFVKTIIQQLNN